MADAKTIFPPGDKDSKELEGEKLRAVDLGVSDYSYFTTSKEGGEGFSEEVRKAVRSFAAARRVGEGVSEGQL